MKWPWQRAEPLFDPPALNTNDLIHLGNLAERLKEDAIFVHSVERALARLRLRWQNERDRDAREELWRTAHAFRLMAAELDAMVSEGKAADAVRQGDKRLSAVNT